MLLQPSPISYVMFGCCGFFLVVVCCVCVVFLLLVFFVVLFCFTIPFIKEVTDAQEDEWKHEVSFL